MTSATRCTRPQLHLIGAAPRRWLCALATGGLLAAAVAPAAAQQSADQILAAVITHRDQTIANVKNYSVVEEINGTRQVTYYERNEHDGHVTFDPVSPFGMVVQDAMGSVLPMLKSRMEQAATSAGLSDLRRQMEGMGGSAFADFIGPLLTPEPGQSQSPGQALSSLTSVDHLKSALLQGAKKVAMHQLEKALLNAAAPQLGTLLQGLTSPGGAGELLHQMSDQISKGQIPTPNSVFGSGTGSTAQGGPIVGAPGLSNAINGAGAALGAAMASKMTSSTAKALNTAFAGPMNLQPADLLDQLSGNAKVTGKEKVDGHDCWVLAAVDASALVEAGSGDVRSPSVQVWVDPEQNVPRQIEMKADARIDGKWTPISMQTHNDDFRTVDGLELPYRTTTILSGQNSTVSDKDRKKMQKSLAQMQKSLAKMPADRRAMVEPMIKSQMARLQAMMGDESVETVVTEVQVNQGPPAEMVEQAKALAKPAGG
jgi:hypothetical protein